MSWEIKSKNNEVKFEVGKVEYNDEWMQERYVTVTIESPTPINFQIGDYLIYRDERFEINYDPGKIKSAPQFEKGDAFRYENVKFNSLADELTRCDFLDVVLGDNQLHFTGLPKFSFYGGVLSLAERIQANLDRAYGKDIWCVEVDTEFSSDTELNVSVDTIKVSGVLEILVNQFKTYYTIKGRTLTIGAAGVPADHLFKYGEGNGLYEIEENAEADQQIVTRLRAYGSTRNIPHRYYNSLTDADGVKLIPDNMAVQHLMLPSFPYTTQDPYIDSKNIDALGVREDTKFFDGSNPDLPEIYPSIEGMTAEQLITAGVPCNATGALDVLVSAEQMTDNGVGKIEGDAMEGNATTTAEPATFKVTIKDVGFDINDHLTTETATISFKTGMLGGREFEIVECKKEGNNYVLELNRVYDEDIKLWFPYKDYNAKTDDKFVLLNIRMPEVYIKAASQRLLEAAEKWLEKNDYSRSIYAPKIDENFMARQHDAAMASGGTIKSLHDTLCAGMQLLFEDEDLGIDAAIFIDRLTIIEGEGPIPTYEVVLKEEKTVGRLDKMQNQIDSLASGQGQGNGGYNASQIRSLINAYGGQLFLSKLKDDRSAGKVASDKAFEVGNYIAGAQGAIIGKDAETGQTFGEMDRLFIRVKAYFETLTIINAETLAGKQYITPGGSVKIISVEKVMNVQGTLTGWKCYFLSEQDGEKTETKMIVGDQAISEMFNAKTGTTNKVSNHRYWRLVTAVNQDAYEENGNHYGYIELSKSNCEAGSDVPEEGDVLCQLGYQGTDNAERQTAMVFSTVDADAPSIKMFSGVGSGNTLTQHYSLNDKAIISFGRDPLTNQVYFRLGNSTAKQYLDYTQSGGLEIAGNISVLSTIGDKTITDYFSKMVTDETDKYKYLADSFKNAAKESTQISGGVILSTLVALGYTENEVHNILSGMNGTYNADLGGRTPAAWYGGNMIDLFDKDNRRINPAPANAAKSLIRMDGSAYFGGGAHAFNADGSGWLGGENMITFNKGAMTFGNGIKINLSSGEQGLKDTLESFANILTYFIPENSQGKQVGWDAGANVIDRIRVTKGFYSDGFISARGANSDGGGTGGGAGFGLMRSWPSSAPANTTTDALGSNLGWELKQCIDNLPTTSVNPYALTIQRNGTTLGNYDGSVAKTINISDVASAATLSTHTSNGTIHITAAERTKWNATSSNLDTILGSNADNVINKWDEIVTFLDTYTEADTLANLLSNKADKATTLAGYGITNAYTKTEADNRYVNVSGDTMSGDLLFANSGTTTRQVRFMVGGSDYGRIAAGATASNEGWVEIASADDGNEPVYARQYTGTFTTIKRTATLLDASGNTSFPNQVTAGSLKIGDCEITWDSARGGLKFSKGIYSESFISARGVNASGGSSSGGGASYSRLDNWTDYASGKEGYVLSAKLGADLHTRVQTIEGKNLVTIGADGVSEMGRYLDFHSANYGTNSTQDHTARIDAGSANIKRVLTLPSAAGTLATQEWVTGKNYLTSHQSLANYYTKTEADGRYLKLAGGTMSNTNAVTNLNADLLDGLHASSFFRFLGTNLDLNSQGNNNDNNGITYINKDAANWSADNQKISYGAALNFNISTLCMQMLIGMDGAEPFYRVRWNNGEWKDWRRIAFTDSNVASATKLAVTRNFWGQPFDGTQSVSGDLTGVGHITPWKDNTADCGSSTNHWNAVRTRQVVSALDATLWIWQSKAQPINFATNGVERMSITGTGDVVIQQAMNTYGARLRFLGNSGFQGAFIGYDGAANILNIGVHEKNSSTINDDFNAISILRINGNVGIGTSAPSEKLDVAGNLRCHNISIGNTSTNGAIELYHSTPYIDFHFGRSSADYTSRIIEEVSGRLKIVGTLRTTVGMYSDGYVSARGQNTSDIRLKTGIHAFNATAIIKALNPKAFKWNSVARHKFKVFDTDEIQYGLIAQETEKVAPWLVKDGMFGDEYKGIWYEKLIPVLLQGQREQIFRIDNILVSVRSHEERIAELERENRELKRKIEILERR